MRLLLWLTSDWSWSCFRFKIGGQINLPGWDTWRWVWSGNSWFKTRSQIGHLEEVLMCSLRQWEFRASGDEKYRLQIRHSGDRLGSIFINSMLRLFQQTLKLVAELSGQLSTKRAKKAPLTATLPILVYEKGWVKTRAKFRSFTVTKKIEAFSNYLKSLISLMVPQVLAILDAFRLIIFK